MFCPVDPSNVPNGKTCYSCDEKSCLNILSCSGSEDRCFKASGENLEKEKKLYLSDVWDHLQVSNFGFLSFHQGLSVASQQS